MRVVALSSEVWCSYFNLVLVEIFLLLDCGVCFWIYVSDLVVWLRLVLDSFWCARFQGVFGFEVVFGFRGVVGFLNYHNDG